MKKFMLFTVSALVLAALALSAFTPGSLAAGKVFSAARAGFVGKSQPADDTPQAPAGASKLEIEKHNGLDDAQPTLEAKPDDNDMEATETPDVNDEAGEVEFSGTIQAMNSDNWMIGDRTVQINAETEIKGTFVVDDQVKVEGFLNAAGTFIAREIHQAEATLEDNSGNKSSDDGATDMSSNSGSTSSTSGSEDHSGKSSGSDDGGGHH